MRVNYALFRAAIMVRIQKQINHKKKRFFVTSCGCYAGIYVDDELSVQVGSDVVIRHCTYARVNMPVNDGNGNINCENERGVVTSYDAITEKYTVWVRRYKLEIPGFERQELRATCDDGLECLEDRFIGSVRGHLMISDDFLWTLMYSRPLIGTRVRLHGVNDKATNGVPGAIKQWAQSFTHNTTTFVVMLDDGTERECGRAEFDVVQEELPTGDKKESDESHPLMMLDDSSDDQPPQVEQAHEHICISLKKSSDAIETSNDESIEQLPEHENSNSATLLLQHSAQDVDDEELHVDDEALLNDIDHKSDVFAQRSLFHMKQSLLSKRHRDALSHLWRLHFPRPSSMASPPGEENGTWMPDFLKNMLGCMMCDGESEGSPSRLSSIFTSGPQDEKSLRSEVRKTRKKFVDHFAKRVGDKLATDMAVEKGQWSNNLLRLYQVLEDARRSCLVQYRVGTPMNDAPKTLFELDNVELEKISIDFATLTTYQEGIRF